MHGINYRHQQWQQRAYPWVLKLQHQSNIDIWWVSQGERIRTIQHQSNIDIWWVFQG